MLFFEIFWVFVLPDLVFTVASRLVISPSLSWSCLVVLCFVCLLSRSRSWLSVLFFLSLIRMVLIGVFSLQFCPLHPFLDALKFLLFRLYVDVDYTSTLWRVGCGVVGSSASGNGR